MSSIREASPEGTVRGGAGPEDLPRARAREPLLAALHLAQPGTGLVLPPERLRAPLARFTALLASSPPAP